MPKKTAASQPTLTPPEDGVQIVSYSELDSFRQCPLKHFLGYKERWTKPTTEGSALSRGSLWHEVLETHYLTIKAYRDEKNPSKRLTKAQEKAVLALCRKAVAPLLDQVTGQTEDQALIEWMYTGYVAHHGADPSWVILGVEEKVQLPIPVPGTTRASGFLLKARLDLRVLDLDTGGVWVVDHKSGANLPSQMDLDIDDQFGLYCWLLRQSGSKVMGAIHNAARTTRNQADFPDYSGKSKPQTLEQRHSRTLLNRTDAELTNISNDAYAAACNMYPEVEGYDPLPMYSSPDPRQCGWKCNFKEAHMLMRQGVDHRSALQDFGFVQDFTRH